ncbi:MAG: NAD(P)-dependent oxidoreductase [Gammaproteobacteria bacterium]|nr:NAD(P)-dependent oxidoreductase [Gammaproteobacteria bacterium]
MASSGLLHGKTLFISGASRGIGLAMALRAAADGANIIIAAKTDKPHPKLPGTIHTAAEEIVAAGGQALPVICDVRDEDAVNAAFAAGAAQFGGIDICINNASAISLTGTTDTMMRRYDLMNQVNARGTFLCSKTAIPYLEEADNPHILNIAPPLDMQAKWFAPHVAYTIAKFGMSLCTLGMAEELKPQGIAVNSLWPLTAINTAAVHMLMGKDAAAQAARSPQIMADAAYEILTRPATELSGRFLVDEPWLRDCGVTDFSVYGPVDIPLAADFFVPDEVIAAVPTKLKPML